jgi:hypothetical protein
MCHIRDLEIYGSRLEKWTGERAMLLLAIRKTYRPVPWWLVWLVWLARWWEGRNHERVGTLRQELFQLEDRRPLPPDAKIPIETRLAGIPVYPRYDATTEIVEPGLQGRRAFAEVQDETVRIPRWDDKTLELPRRTG